MGFYSVRREKSALYFILGLTAILAFFAGYGFQRFVSYQASSNRASNLHRRSLNNDKYFEKRNFESSDFTSRDQVQESKRFRDDALRDVNKTYMQNMLEMFSREPHMGGSKRNLDLANYMKEQWIEFGWDTVEFKDYDAYLSFPKEPALIELYDESDKLVFSETVIEKPLYDKEYSNESVYPFNAYSGSGDVKTGYVYVNYAEIRDYAKLMKLNITLEGKVHISKYGYAFRGEKARLAELYGAVALLLYPDPKDHNDMGTAGYPESWEMPSSAIPRGNILNTKGDPLTPLYAAKDGYFRRNPDKVDHFAKIPIQPISYDLAYKLMSDMDGEDPNDELWQGGMNFNYTISPKDNRTMRLRVNTPKEFRKIRNVVATIQGSQEPDRIVMIGNHRDGWVYGGLDPSSGTAVLMEVARLLGRERKSGWKPRRTVMIISWDAEEYGLIGSVEWGQEYHHLLAQRVVAYLNVDIAVSGNYTFRAKASPSLIDQLYEITKNIDDPDDGNKLYESWRTKSRVDPPKPLYTHLGSGSDFTYFASAIGISCIDIRYMYDQGSHPGLSNYPAYHTIHDNYEYMMKYIDPEFKYHPIVAKVMLAYAFKLADAVVLPFSLVEYASKIRNDTEMFDETLFNETLKPHNLSLCQLKDAASDLLEEAKRFQDRLCSVNQENIAQVRRFNDQMMFFDRAFIRPEGLPNTPDIKHVIYAPMRKTLYDHKLYPGISEMLYQLVINNKTVVDEVKEQISVAVSHLNAAKDSISQMRSVWEVENENETANTEQNNPCDYKHITF